MKQIKASAVLVLMVALFAVFCFGVLVGRSNESGGFRIVTDRQTIEHTTEAPTEGKTEIKKQEVTQVTTAAPTEPSTEADPYPININTATAEELMLLTKIGPTLAERIIAYRENYGPFETVKELDMVEGIGEKILEDVLELITLEE